MIFGKLNISHNTPGDREMDVGTVMVTRTGSGGRGYKGRRGGGGWILAPPHLNM